MAAGKWWQLAVCRSADLRLFFPVSSTSRSLEQAAGATAICALPGPAPVSGVRAADQAVHGIWGGLTEEVRHQAATTRQGP
jgi:Transcription factor WhiB